MGNAGQTYALVCKALRECQIALCPDFETCADNLKDGEKCACGYDGGPHANAVPKNRAAERLREGLWRIAGQEYDAGYTPETYADAILSGHEPLTTTEGTIMERRRGYSKLVYDKKRRTIVTVVTGPWWWRLWKRLFSTHHH